jgi:hypothetical protein
LPTPGWPFERWTDQPERAAFSGCVREAAAELADSLEAADIPGIFEPDSIVQGGPPLPAAITGP